MLLTGTPNFRLELLTHQLYATPAAYTTNLLPEQAPARSRGSDGSFLPSNEPRVLLNHTRMLKAAGFTLIVRHAFAIAPPVEGKLRLDTKRPSARTDGPKTPRLKFSTQRSVSTSTSLLAPDRGNLSDSNRFTAQASRHLHRLPAQALELVLIIHLVHFPVADENVLGAA